MDIVGVIEGVGLTDEGGVDDVEGVIKDLEGVTEGVTDAGGVLEGDGEAGGVTGTQADTDAT